MKINAEVYEQSEIRVSHEFVDRAGVPVSPVQANFRIINRRDNSVVVDWAPATSIDGAVVTVDLDARHTLMTATTEDFDEYACIVVAQIAGELALQTRRFVFRVVNLYGVLAGDGDLTPPEVYEIEDVDAGANEVVESPDDGAYTGLTVATAMPGATITLDDQSEPGALDLEAGAVAGQYRVVVADGSRILHVSSAPDLTPPPVAYSVYDVNADPNTVEEGAAEGTPVGLTVSTDMPNASISISEQDEPGALKVVAGSAAGQWLIVVEDGSRLININTSAPSAPGVYSISDINAAANTVVEGSAADTPVGVVATTDMPNATISISSQQEPGALKLVAGDNPGEYVLAVADGSRIVFPSAPVDSTPRDVVAFSLSQVGPFALAHVFREGDVPSVATLGVDGQAFQATALSSWPSGSVRQALIAGSPSGAGPFTLNTGAGQASGADIALADLRAMNPSASIQFAGGISDLVSLDVSAAPVKQLTAGPKMSEWVFKNAVPGQAHLTVYWRLRYWGGSALDIFIGVENGYMDEATSGGPVTYSATVSVNGVTRYSLASAVHYFTTRWGKFLGMYSGGTAARPVFDYDYIDSTKIFPHYSTRVAPSDAKLNALAVPEQFARGDYPTGMGAPGFSESIGLLPNWSALALTSGGDVRAWNSMIAHSLAYGRYPLFLRSKATDEPALLVDFPAAGEVDVPGSTSGAPAYVISHAPDPGFAAAMLTGEWWFQEQLAMTAFWNSLYRLPYREGDKGIFVTSRAKSIRGAAWSLRTLMHAAIAAREGSAVKSEMLRQWGHNIDFYRQTYVTGEREAGQYVNSFGFPKDYNSTENDPPNNGSLVNTPGYGQVWYGASFMAAFLQAVMAWASDLKLGFKDAEQVSVRNFLYQATVGLIGEKQTAGQHDYRFSAVYYSPFTIGTSQNDPANLEYFDNWGQVFDALVIGQGITSDAVNDTNLRRHGDVSSPGVNGADELIRASDFVTGYWGNHNPARAWAVDHGFPGAAAAFQRITAAANYTDSLTAGWGDQPVWAVIPRTNLELPAWVEALPFETWTPIPNTKMSDITHAQPAVGILTYRASHGAWTGMAAWRDKNVLIGVANGGHGDLANNQCDYLDLNADAPAWVEGWPGSKVSGLPTRAEYQIPPYSDAPLQGDLLNVSKYYLPDAAGRFAPAALHTYQNIEILEDSGDVVISVLTGGMNWNYLKAKPPGFSGLDESRFPLFDFQNQQWRFPQEFLPPFPDTGQFIGGSTVTDPRDHALYVIRENRSSVWKLVRNAASWVSAPLGRQGRYGASAIDTRRGKLLHAGTKSPGEQRPALFDLTTFSADPQDFSGPQYDVLTVQSPSLEYVEAIDKYVFLTQGSSDTAPSKVYTIDPANGYAVAPLPSATDAPGTISTDPQSRMRYFPRIGVMVYQHHWDQNASAYRVRL